MSGLDARIKRVLETLDPNSYSDPDDMAGYMKDSREDIVQIIKELVEERDRLFAGLEFLAKHPTISQETLRQIAFRTMDGEDFTQMLDDMFEQALNPKEDV